VRVISRSHHHRHHHLEEVVKAMIVSRKQLNSAKNCSRKLAFSKSRNLDGWSVPAMVHPKAWSGVEVGAASPHFPWWPMLAR
jgi:hypothetical protein